MTDTMPARSDTQGQGGPGLVNSGHERQNGQVAAMSVITDDQEMQRGPELPSEIVAASLRERIEAGEWAPDQALPSVAALAAHYQVARSSVARALRILAAEGLVRVRPRWGTFRAGPRDD